MPQVARAIDDMFHGSPVPTKSESEQAFKADFIATLGSVKAFILSICGAVLFTTLLVCANTMAMSIRERTREVAVLRTLGFTRGSILKLLLSESIAILGNRRTDRRRASRAWPFSFMARPGMGMPVSMHMTAATALVVMLVARFRRAWSAASFPPIAPRTSASSTPCATSAEVRYCIIDSMTK